MQSFYKKWRKIFWAIFALNAIIAVGQLFFAYGHYIKHEYLLLGVSLSLVCLNGWTAAYELKQIRKLNQEERQTIINILSTKEYV